MAHYLGTDQGIHQSKTYSPPVQAGDDTAYRIDRP